MTPEYHAHAIEKITGHTFTPTHFPTLIRAIHAAGAPYTYAGTTSTRDGNKGLALLGDSVQRLCIHTSCLEPRTQFLFMTPEEMHNISAPYITNAFQAKMGEVHGLAKHVVLPDSCQGRASVGQVADLVEAILGAVFLDAGMREAGMVMRRLGLGPGME